MLLKSLVGLHTVVIQICAIEQTEEADFSVGLCWCCPYCASLHLLLDRQTRLAITLTEKIEVYCSYVNVSD